MWPGILDARHIYPLLGVRRPWVHLPPNVQRVPCHQIVKRPQLTSFVPMFPLSLPRSVAHQPAHHQLADHEPAAHNFLAHQLADQFADQPAHVAHQPAHGLSDPASGGGHMLPRTANLLPGGAAVGCAHRRRLHHLLPLQQSARGVHRPLQCGSSTPPAAPTSSSPSAGNGIGSSSGSSTGDEEGMTGWAVAGIVVVILALLAGVTIAIMTARGKSIPCINGSKRDSGASPRAMPMYQNPSYQTGGAERATSGPESAA